MRILSKKIKNRSYPFISHDVGKFLCACREIACALRGKQEIPSRLPNKEFSFRGKGRSNKMQRTIGLIVHRTRPEAQAFAEQVVVWLQERGIEVRLERDMAERLGYPEFGCETVVQPGIEFVITLGGDGLILKIARMAAPYRIPILGVHMGRFGFIAEAHPDNLFTYLHAILNGTHQFEERVMVHAEVFREDERVYSATGLNEALVKSGLSHLVHLRLFLRDAPFATYPADGIIVATPTGSTGYALSAGGPIVEPTVKAFVLVPICPHTLSARPMVVPDTDRIELLILNNDGEVLFAVDGVAQFPLQKGDRVCIRRADYTTRLFVLEPASFYRKVRARYLYGERLTE